MTEAPKRRGSSPSPVHTPPRKEDHQGSVRTPESDKPRLRWPGTSVPVTSTPKLPFLQYTRSPQSAPFLGNIFFWGEDFVCWISMCLCFSYSSFCWRWSRSSHSG